MTHPSDKVVQEVREEDGVVLVKLAGEIDMHRTPEVMQAVDEHMRSKPKRVVVDLSEVDYMDSSGVGTLVHLFRQVNSNGGKLILVKPNERVRSVFEITRLGRFFVICQDQQEALKQ